MKYKDLIQFDPIEDVIQLRTADKATEGPPPKSGGTYLLARKSYTSALSSERVAGGTDAASTVPSIPL